jgi:adenylate kinase
VILVLLGSPGSGKGSQAALLKQYYNIPHISTGDLFRSILSQSTPLSEEVKSYVNLGYLVPDSVTNKVISQRLTNPDTKNGFILDGYPRNVGQAEYLNTLLKSKGLEVDYLLNLNVDDSVVISRLSGRRTCPKCGTIFHITNNPSKEANICDHCGATLVTRKDDQEETIINRLEVYKNETLPLTQYYKKGNYKFIDLDASISVDDTFVQIKEAITL